MEPLGTFRYRYVADRAGLCPRNPPRPRFRLSARDASDVALSQAGPHLSFAASGAVMQFECLSDHFIIQMYESIREQAFADTVSGISLLGNPAKERAEELHQEIERRGLFCVPIEWHDGDQSDRVPVAGGNPALKA